jgi:hypothetical protein
MTLIVAALTQSDEVSHRGGPAVGQRDDVMHFGARLQAEDATSHRAALTTVSLPDLVADLPPSSLHGEPVRGVIRISPDLGDTV